MEEPPQTQAREVVIDGYQYEIRPLDAWTAVPVFTRVAKVVVPTLDSLGSSAGALAALADGGDGVAEMAVIAKLATHAASVAVRLMDPADLQYCMEAFARRTVVTLGTKSPSLKEVFPVHFAGRLASMCKWFGASAEVNFGDFLEVARGMWISAQKQKSESDAAKRATATAPSDSPAASTG